MTRFNRLLAFVCAGLILLAGCKKKFDEYYEPPVNGDPAIYKQLEQRGNFTRLISLINKAGYKQTLGSAGYWTMFAPTDSAFQNDAEFTTWLQGRGITSFDAIDSTTAQAVVQYLLVFNGFAKDRLDDYQSNLGWVVNDAFKRRTAYYTGFYNDTNSTGQSIKAVASNRNNTGTGTGYFVFADNNNKYIPFFTSEYFTAKGLNASDYNYFFPSSTYSGFNVAQARVREQNIAAENGFIHVIDKVVTPLSSIDQYLRTRPEYSEFKKLLDRYMVQFVQNADATQRYAVLTGEARPVHVKVYSNLLAYSPNNENFFKLQDNDGQRDGWTMFAPKNDSLLKYIDDIGKEGYGPITNFPTSIIADLLNSHMWQTTVWPSRFNQTYNFLGEPAHVNATADISVKKVLSNGFFYGTNKVNEPDIFSSVYGKAYLNPKFSIMTRLLNTELRSIISNNNVKFTVFMVPDAVLNAQGFNYNLAANSWTFNGTGNDSNRLNLLRMLNSSVVETPNGELDNIGNAGFTATVNTFGGEFIQFNGNRIISGGTKDRNLTVTIDSIKTAKNGRVVYLNNLLYFSYQPIGKHIETLGTPATSEYNLFWNYLKNSTVYDAVTSSIIGTSGGAFYTVFSPNNASVRQAITDGLLPGTAATPNFTPTTTADRLKVEKFILYHVLDKRSISNDGKDVGNFATLLKNINGDPVTVNVAYPGGVFELSDAFNRKSRLVTAQSNQLSNRAMIHLLDNYLKYN